MRDAAVTGGRPDIAAAGRVVVKVGSSSLTSADGAIDDQRIAALAEVLVGRVRAGGQAVLVSSGAIASRLVPLGLPRRPRDLPPQHAAASVRFLPSRHQFQQRRFSRTVGADQADALAGAQVQ